MNVVADGRVLNVGTWVNHCRPIEVPGYGVEIRFGRADVIPRVFENEGMDSLPFLEPLEEPPWLVGVVVTSEVFIEARQNITGEAIAGGGSKCCRGVVGLFWKSMTSSLLLSSTNL